MADNILNKAFSAITDKVEKALSQQGFTQQNVASDDGEKVAMFTNGSLIYSVIYTEKDNHLVLRSCGMTEEGPDNDWKNMATWLFDPESDTMADAESIGKDFAEMLGDKTQLKKVQQAKKKKKKNKDEGSADPEFLAKRFVTFFPELKDEIKEEADNYYPFRGVTFTREHIVPRVKEYMKNPSKKQVEKLAQLLNRQYNNGDADTRSIVNIVIINSLTDEQYDKLYEHFDEDMQKYSKGGRKYIGKTVKPEKVKKKKTSRFAETLQNQQ